MLYNAASHPPGTPVLDPSTASRPSCIESVVAIAFRCESLHPDHHGISQHPVQYHLAFNFGGNVECIGGIAFRAESLHPGHHSIVQHPVQYPLTFSFGGNGECTGGIAFRPESLYPGHHIVAQQPVQHPLTFSFGGNVECIGGIAPNPSIEVTETFPSTRYNAPSQPVGIMTPGASTAVRAVLITLFSFF
ncbi:hypothetical protein B0H16DRAFT_1739817 [Mycena metata]|uniref:Uncharacterized protein n=1 Tax=Mycena metata TaxID=1033252 RepID=A0AAD7HFU9_9AGAR|nr:hypothetical protein B0H16DRAFT_1739817 [Mycena metata]